LDKKTIGEEKRYYNGMFLVNHQEERVEHSYYKRVLLAFGEYVPLSSVFPFLQKMAPAVGQFTPGPGPEAIAWKDKRGREHRLGVSICYEAIIPRFVNGLASKNPDVFINITNDSWYGNTREPYFHFHLQGMRAIEYRRYLFRLANTGFSAIVSPYGEISQSTELNSQKTLIAKVPLVSQKPTIYNQFGYWGLRILILVLTALGFYRIWSRLRR
jgi:apolipoprotein N-acyltransferase